MTRLLSLCGCFVVMCVTAPAWAQAPHVEDPDATRLDVERLPPEALEVTRDMYEIGPYFRGQLGGRGFIGGVGRLSEPGVFASVAMGQQFTQWFFLGGLLEVSQHASSAPPPPTPTNFQLYGAAAEVKFQLPLSARSALWLAGQGGLAWTSGNLLSAYGLADAGTAALMYGGNLGFDWHLRNLHHSLGLMAGARRYPNLDGADGEAAIGAEASLYMQYVF